MSSPLNNQEPDRKNIAKIYLTTTLLGTLIAIFFMFNALDTAAAIIGTAVLVIADALCFLAFYRAYKKKPESK